ncbi:unnamed protein product [Ilex paraguariensis]|uniref:Uncharacterized protein n=1 Tax=Ilex paraguariensis TaxID=185542 RepID=A0ABC8TV69_9AQUA
MGTNPASLLVSPDLFLDSSKEYSGGDDFPQYEFANSMTSWQPYDRYEISPSSSFPNFREDVELSDDLSRLGCMSPYSEQGNYMGYYGDLNLSCEGFQGRDQASICRQSSGDGSLEEYNGLWSHEDNFVSF